MVHSFMFERFSAVGTDHLLQVVNINYSYAVGILIVLWITLLFASFKNPFKSSENIKLNCWYCNHDSYITLGKRETQEYWLCAFCGSENARSQVIIKKRYLCVCVKLIPPFFFKKVRRGDRSSTTCPRE